MTNGEIATVFTSVLDLPVVYVQTPLQGMAPPKPDASGEPPRPEIDLGALRAALPGLVTLEEWVRATGWTS